MPRSSRLETHDHSTCGFMAWCRKSGAQVAGKLENSTAIVAADGEKSARIDLEVLPAFDKCPNEGKDEQLRSLLQHSFDELKLRYDGHVARFDCLTPQEALHRCELCRVLAPGHRGCFRRHLVCAAGPLPTAVVLTPCVAPIVIPRHVCVWSRYHTCYQKRQELGSVSLGARCAGRASPLLA